MSTIKDMLSVKYVQRISKKGKENIMAKQLRERDKLYQILFIYLFVICDKNEKLEILNSYLINIFGQL